MKKKKVRSENASPKKQVLKKLERDELATVLGRKVAKKRVKKAKRKK